MRGDGAAAGAMLLLTIVLFSLAGFGLGLLLDIAAIGAIAGGFLGLVAGFTIVYKRFKNV